MDDVQIRNAAMVGLLGSDVGRAQDRNVAFRAYDSAGVATFTTAITVPLATEALNTAPSLFDLASNELEITETGIFLVQFAVTAEYSSGGGGSGNIHVFLEQDAGGGFAAIAGSHLYFTASDPASISGGLALRVAASDVIRLRVERNTGADTFALVASASWLSVVVLSLFR